MGLVEQHMSPSLTYAGFFSQNLRKHERPVGSWSWLWIQAYESVSERQS
jgi:hypothetical protein